MPDSGTTVQKPSTRQFEEHIEYLKGELARATSQLHAARSEVAASREALAAAQVEASQLRGELSAARAELAARAAAEPRASGLPSAPSAASSHRCTPVLATLTTLGNFGFMSVETEDMA